MASKKRGIAKLSAVAGIWAPASADQAVLRDDRNREGAALPQVEELVELRQRECSSGIEFR